MKTIIYGLFIICASIYAQTSDIDSLTLLLKSASHDTIKIRLYQHLSEIDTDEKLEKYSDKSSVLINSQLTILPKNSKAYLNILCFKAANLENFGLVEQNKGQLSKAIDYHFKALKIRESINDKKATGASLQNIGLVYSTMGEMDKALEFYEKSYALCIKIGSKKMAAYSLNGIADVCLTRNDYKKALEFYLKSLVMKEDINDKYGIGYSLNNIGVVYKKMEEMDSAIFYFKKSLAIREEINDRNGIVYSYINISRTAFVQNNLQEAKLYGEMAFKLSKEISFPNIIRYSADALQNIYEKQKNYQKAYEMLKVAKEMGEIIVNDDTKKEMLRKEMEYNYFKKNIADSIIVVEEKKLTTVKLKQEKTQRYYLYAGLGLTVLFGIFMFNRFRITQKQKNIINEQKTIVENQKHIVEEKQKEILDSIRYAKRIQTAFFPSEKYIERIIKKNFKN